MRGWSRERSERGFLGSRERSERGFFAPHARFFANSTTVFKDFDGFRLLRRALFGHTHEASHEWEYGTHKRLCNINMVEFSSSYMWVRFVRRAVAVTLSNYRLYCASTGRNRESFIVIFR